MTLGGPIDPATIDLSPLLVLDPDRLGDIARAQRRLYAKANPFPHVVLDGIFPEALLRRILTEFPDVNAPSWRRFKDGAQAKLDNRMESSMGPATRLLLYQLNSSIFLNFLESLTGIEGLIPDPHFGGGGLHQIERGGFLKIHADFNWHPGLKLDRRLNFLLYLNDDWLEEYGGRLELWSRDMSRCEKKVLPIFNRCVIFNTTDFSFHGHPDPLTCPAGRSRKSLALYYYSNGRPAEEKSAEHSTVFRSRPDEELILPKLGNALHRFVPPIALDLLGYFRRKEPPGGSKIP